MNYYHRRPLLELKNDLGLQTNLSWYLSVLLVLMPVVWGLLKVRWMPAFMPIITFIMTNFGTWSRRLDSTVPLMMSNLNHLHQIIKKVWTQRLKDYIRNQIYFKYRVWWRLSLLSKFFTRLDDGLKVEINGSAFDDANPAISTFSRHLA